MSIIASRIIEARKAKKLSQSGLARLLDMTPQAVQKWEAGKSTPRNQNIHDLCVVLGVSAAYLLGGDEASSSVENVSPSIAGRIAEARKAKKINQSELARLVSVTPQAVQSWESGKSTPRSQSLHDLSDALGVSTAFLLGDEQTLPAMDSHLSVSVVAPNSLLNRGNLKIIAYQPLQVHEISSRGIDPDKVVGLIASGNSLSPIVLHGSVVCIDRGNTAVVDGCIYAVAQQGEVRIKIAYRLPGAGLRLSNFNRSEYEDELYSSSDIEDQGISILGKVFWVSNFLP